MSGGLLLAACGKISAPTAAGPAPHGLAAAALPTSANQAAFQFISSAVGDDIFEVRTAQIAAARAKAPAVRAFASLMAKDHAASMAAFNAAIAQSGQNLPAPTSLPDKLQSMLDELNRGTALDFDKTYIEQQIEAQEDALSLLSAYAQSGGVPTIKATALRFAPTVQAHLDQARAIEETLNKEPPRATAS
jgi:putative membrane protein